MKLIKLIGNQIYLQTLTLHNVNEDYVRWMNDEMVNKYTESRFEKWNVKKLTHYYRVLQKDSSIYFFGIFLKSDKHIGNIKLGPINSIHKYADIGIIIGEKQSWGKGFATEAIRLLTQYAFDSIKLNKLNAGAYSNNIGSIKAFQKAGFVVEGIRKKQYKYKGKYIDGVILGFTRK